jgi:hypothetical protein
MKPRWIAVTERLPPELPDGATGHWWAFHPDRGVWIETTRPSWWNQRHGDGPSDWCSDFDGPFITHWFPCDWPEPPKL